MQTLIKVLTPAPPVLAIPPRKQSIRPPPIDINLAERLRTLSLQLKQKIKPVTLLSPSSSASTSSSTISPFTLDSPERTPVHVHVYHQIRLPASSTPFPGMPTNMTQTPAQILPPPNTAEFQTPITTDTPTSTCSSSYSSPPSSSMYSPKTSFRLSTQQTSTMPSFPSARSLRMEMLLRILVDPIDTDAKNRPTNPKWYQMKTPIQGRWDLFLRPSQLRLARLAEDAWYYGEGDSDEGFSDRQNPFDDRFEGRQGSDEDDSGYDGLPEPISPLDEDMRKVVDGRIW